MVNGFDVGDIVMAVENSIRNTKVLGWIKAIHYDEIDDVDYATLGKVKIIFNWKSGKSKIKRYKRKLCEVSYLKIKNCELSLFQSNEVL
jgi:hypothetical protein